MIYVIGSGPTGISTVVALIKKGFDVTMLDVEFDLEPERTQVVRQFLQLNKNFVAGIIIIHIYIEEFYWLLMFPVFLKRSIENKTKLFQSHILPAKPVA